MPGRRRASAPEARESIQRAKRVRSNGFSNRGPIFLTETDSASNWPANRPPLLDDLDNLDGRREDWRARFAAADAEAGIETTAEFEPFTQRNDMFTRAFWDADVQSEGARAFFESYRAEAIPRRGEGFSQKDFALRNAAWSVSDIFSNRGNDVGLREGFQAAIVSETPVAPEKIEIDDIAALTREIKRIAVLFGADLVGITEIDERWHYAARVDTRDMSDAPLELPEGLTHVIVLGHAMDPELVRTYPSALAGAATGMEYSNEAAATVKLATYIRNLGFEAIASMNDTALVIPYAVKAGLGEYGRNQMVITPEYGPRVRFAKIFTALPLISDRPRSVGVKAYCDICTRCADACPPKALPFGPPDDTVHNRSSIRGVKKWTADCEKCFGYWARIRTDCAICMRVCPFTVTSNAWSRRLWRRLALGRFRKLALWWDRKFNKAERLKPREWWARISGG